MLKILFYLGTFYTALLGIIAFFFDYSKLPNIAKWALGIIAIFAVAFALWYDNHEKIIEEKEKEYSDMIASSERRRVTESLEQLKQKEEKGLLTGSDYLRYISLYLENMDINLKSLNLKIKKDFLLDYYSDLEKIPNYYNFDEWKESADVIYKRSIDRINSDFNARGRFNSGTREPLLKELEKENSKLIKAKEREYSTR